MKKPPSTLSIAHPVSSAHPWKPASGYLAATLGFLVALGGWSALYAADRGIERTIAIGPGGTLSLDAEVGTVELVGSERADVYVRVLRGSDSAADIEDDYDVSFDQNDNELEIEIERRGRFRWLRFGWGPSLDIRIEVPRRFDADLRTSGGSVHVTAIDGEVRARTAGGNLLFDEITGDIDGRTSGGSITLENALGNAELGTSGGTVRVGEIRGDLDITSSGGSIHVESVDGAMSARTSGGSIEIERARGAVVAESSGGGVRAYIAEQPSSDCNLSSSGGSVIVYLDESLALDIDASSSGGQVRSDLPVTVQGKLESSRLNGKLNGGGPKLRLRSSGGGIRIEARKR